MRGTTAGLLSLALASGIGVTLSSTAAYAAPPADAGPGGAAAKGAGPDELPNPLEDKRRELRSEAITSVINGTATPQTINGSKVVKVGQSAESKTAATGKGKTAATTATKKKNQYVELAREKSDKIFVILAEFGNQRDPRYPDQDTNASIPGPTRFDGPLHNEIDEPNRAVDNTTVWQADYNRQHYQDLYFGKGAGVESLRTYYEKQSSGRYSVNGEVSDWVKVPYNEARYGRSNGYPCASQVCSNTWALIQDAVNQWTLDQQAAGRTDAQIVADLKQYDQWDRYDYDGDGNFNEPDGYLDHFQIVHAGGDQADGDPYQGEDAIWSHRWYAYGTGGTGHTGPATNPLGGAQIGTTGLWVGDYTIQPENGGLSVFTHEYGHDLGLPDSYDTSGLGDNNNEYWTLMAQSRLNAAGEPLGTRPGDIGQWEKLQLGWLDYATVLAGQQKSLTLGPAEYNSASPQGVVVVLPKKSVVTDNGAPAEGTKQWWSGSADNLNSSLTRDINLTGKTSASMSFKGRWDVETDYDYVYLEASLDGGSTWTALNGTVNGKPFGVDSAGRPALFGTQPTWADVVVPMDVAAGQVVTFRFHYLTDGGAAGNDGAVPNGFFADAISVTADGATVFTDGAEAGNNGWTPAGGFSIVGGSTTALFDNYYIATNRTYTSFDKYLKTGPYNFGFPSKPDFVEHYAYQTGLLVSYWDTSQSDNNTNVHPGEGLSMIIDSHPQTMYNLCGTAWRSRIQMYDAPFGVHKMDSMTLHCGANERASLVRGQSAQPLFDDTKTYWYADQPNHGVKLPAAGVKIRVVDEMGTSVKVRVS